MNQTKTIALHVDIRIWKTIKIAATREETTISAIAEEALMSWFKWIKKAELEEAQENEKIRIQAELDEAIKVLDEIQAAKGKNKGKMGRGRKEKG